MDEWRCVKVTRASKNWTLGRVYRTNKSGRLIDDIGKERLTPECYNERGTSTLFEKVPTSLLNE